MKKYIIKDSLNTYIKMVDTLGQVYEILDNFKNHFENDNYSTFGPSLDGSHTLEDNALFEIPVKLRPEYRNQEYIKIYFFRFDCTNNKIVDLY